MLVSNYPFNGEAPKRTVVLRGTYNVLSKYKGKPRPINAGERPGEPAEVPVLTVKPCQTDAERGEGDSTNSRMYRLCGSKK